MKPTYWQCESVCKWDFDFDANESGKVPIGTLWDGSEWTCQCGNPDV